MPPIYIFDIMKLSKIVDFYNKTAHAGPLRYGLLGFGFTDWRYPQTILPQKLLSTGAGSLTGLNTLSRPLIIKQECLQNTGPEERPI